MRLPDFLRNRISPFFVVSREMSPLSCQAADIEIQAKEILFIRALLCEYIADYTGQVGCSSPHRLSAHFLALQGASPSAWQPVEKIEDDCDRDFFMTPEEAKDYGIIDEVLSSKVRIPTPGRPELIY